MKLHVESRYSYLVLVISLYLFLLNLSSIEGAYLIDTNLFNENRDSKLIEIRIDLNTHVDYLMQVNMSFCVNEPS